MTRTERQGIVIMQLRDILLQVSSRSKAWADKIDRDGWDGAVSADLEILRDAQRAWCLAKEAHILRDSETEVILCVPTDVEPQ